MGKHMPHNNPHFHKVGDHIYEVSTLPKELCPLCEMEAEQEKIVKEMRRLGYLLRRTA